MQFNNPWVLVRSFNDESFYWTSPLFPNQLALSDRDHKPTSSKSDNLLWIDFGRALVEEVEGIWSLPLYSIPNSTRVTFCTPEEAEWLRQEFSMRLIPKSLQQST